MYYESQAGPRSGVNHMSWWGSGRNRAAAAFSAGLLGFAAVLSVAGVTACTSKSSSNEKEATAALNVFWTSADESVHDVQSSLRDARRVGVEMGAETAKDDYGPIIALGHRLGGLGHDHATPADNVPVVPMLDTMFFSIESLLRSASTSAELDEANRATDATVAKLSLRTQRLYHLLSAKKKVALVRSRATAIGFRPGT